MKNIKQIVSTLVALIVSAVLISSTYAAQPFVDLQSFYTANITSSVSSSATTITVNTAPSVNTAFLVMEPRTTNQEIVYMTSRSGTTLTVVRGLATSGSILTSAGNGKPHPAGSRIEIADVHYYIKTMQIAPAFTFRGVFTTPTFTTTNQENLDIAFSTTTERWNVFNGTDWVQMGDNTESIGGIKNFIGGLLGTASSTFSSTLTLSGPTTISDGRASTWNEAITFSPINRPKYASHPTFVADEELIDKKYADDLAIAGSPDASLTVKGIAEIATRPEVAAGTKFGDTGAFLVIPAEYATSTPTIPTNSVMVSNSSGKLDPGWVSGQSYSFGTTTINGVSSDTIPNVRVFSSNGTWTKPAGLKYIVVEVVGGGGGGRSQSGVGGAPGGGGGGYAKKIIAASLLNDTEAVVVGNGGAAGATGGNSTFRSGAFLSGNGGQGAGADSALWGGQGGTASGGDVNMAGNGGGSPSSLHSGHGGGSYFGGGARGQAGVDTNGTAGVTNTGGGGSGAFRSSSGSSTGGSGGSGVVIVTEYFW